MNPRLPLGAPVISLGYRPEPTSPAPSVWGTFGSLIGTAAAITVFAAAILGFFAR